MAVSPDCQQSSVGSSRRGYDEVDAVHNPTQLFRKINSGNWEGALNIVRHNPSEASVWVSRRKTDGSGQLAWKYLPLHLICLQQQPHEELFMALLQSYPQAASLPTPHDGSLPIHCMSESGCTNEHILYALLESFPQSINVENKKGKTPWLLCHGKSKALLDKVLRQQHATLPSFFNDGQQQQKQHRPPTKKSAKYRKRGTAERRNDTDTSWKDPSIQQSRQPSSTSYRSHRTVLTDNTPPTVVTHNNHLCAYKDEWDDKKTPRVSNNRRSSRRGTKREEDDVLDEPSFFPNSNTPDYSSNEYDRATASYTPSKTAEVSQTFLYQALEETEEDEAQEREDNINFLTHEDDIPNSTDSSSQLCARIMAKAEADNVSFRTRIQELQDERNELMRTSEAKEIANTQCFEQVRQILSNRATEMKINIFNDRSTPWESLDDSDKERNEIVEALQTVLSHMDDRNNALHTKISSLEADLNETEIALKKIQIKDQHRDSEKVVMSKQYREVERKAAILEEDKTMVQSGLSHLKDRVSTLTVINQSLQDQIDAMESSQVKQENDQLKLEVTHLEEKLAEMVAEKDNATQSKYSQEQAVELEKKIELLTEKNRLLKDTILANNDKYSKKLIAMAEGTRSSSDSRSVQIDMQVHQEGEEVSYEV